MVAVQKKGPPESTQGRTRPTLPSQASPKAVAAVSKARASKRQNVVKSKGKGKS